MSLGSLILGWAVALGVGSAAPQASFPEDAAIQRMIEERVARNGAGGIVVATWRPGERARIHAAGTSGRHGVPMDGDTLFEIGSITKTFTTALLADMAGRGEVQLDDPVADHLRGLRVPERDGRKISLLDLATHMSGLPAIPSNISPKDMDNPYADYTAAMLEQFLSEYSLTRDIGSRFEYSAVGMALLGRALGDRLGTSWEAALAERILRPLGMASTGVALPDGAAGRLAAGHDATGRPVPNWDIPALPAMGALRSSANDLIKFLAANIEGSGPLGAALASAHVPRVSMDEETRVGLAWQTGHATNRRIVWHGGGTGGYRSLIAFDPETKLGVVVLSNSASGADEIGFHLLDRSLPPN